MSTERMSESGSKARRKGESDMAQVQDNSIFDRLMAWLGFSPSFTQQEVVALVEHRDIWLGNRDPKLEKSVRHYSFQG